MFLRELYQQKYYQFVLKGTETVQNEKKKKVRFPKVILVESRKQAEKTTQLKYMLPLIQKERFTRCIQET